MSPEMTQTRWRVKTTNNRITQHLVSVVPVIRTNGTEWNWCDIPCIWLATFPPTCFRASTCQRCSREPQEQHLVTQVMLATGQLLRERSTASNRWYIMNVTHMKSEKYVDSMCVHFHCLSPLNCWINIFELCWRMLVKTLTHLPIPFPLGSGSLWFVWCRP